jgi:predicted small metal-binding protein
MIIQFYDKLTRLTRSPYIHQFYYQSLMLSINCKEAGDPQCSHTITGATEQELFENAKKHAMDTHGMTAQQFKEDAKKNEGKYKMMLFMD